MNIGWSEVRLELTIEYCRRHTAFICKKAINGSSHNDKDLWRALRIFRRCFYWCYSVVMINFWGALVVYLPSQSIPLALNKALICKEPIRVHVDGHSCFSGRLTSVE